MATNFRLTLIAPKEYNVEKFDNDVEIWSETDPNKTTSSRYTLDPERPSVMRIKGKTWTFGDCYTFGDGLHFDDSPSGKNEGAYKDFDVTPNVTYAISFLYRTAVGDLKLVLYDQTNQQLIGIATLNSSSWASFCEAVKIPKNCQTLRIKFLQSDSSHSSPFYIDDVSVNGNAILTDPDSYERVLERVGNYYQMLSGKKVHDLRAIHYKLRLKWNYVDPVQYESLRQIFFSNETLYFDDGNVPPLIEHHTIHVNDTYNYHNIENPSTRHIAYKCASSSLPLMKTDFSESEYSTLDYQAIYEDNDSYCETKDPDPGCYLYHKFDIKSEIPRSAVKRLRVKISAMGKDTSPYNTDGCILYGWNGSKWVELTRTTNSDKNYLMYETSESIIASSLVDPNDCYIRLLLRSMGLMREGNSLVLRTYYVEVELNEDLDSIVRLTHKAILDNNGDVIWVKNLSKGKDLVLGTDYEISIDRRSIIVNGQDPGDQIEVKYNRYFECMITNLPEQWIYGDGEARQITMELQTLSESR